MRAVFAVFAGEHVRHCQLEYVPLSPSAVTACSSDHIIVAERRARVLHVHSLDGREVGRHEVDGVGRHEVDGRSGDWIWGIRCSTDGVLHVATGLPFVRGEDFVITMLTAYKVTANHIFLAIQLRVHRYFVTKLFSLPSDTVRNCKRG
jgi:hypothetical protein